MDDKFIIQGQQKLQGEIEARGSKNAAGAILAATLLTNKPCVVSNLPLVKDILNLIDILKEMGCAVEWLGKREVKITAGDNVDPSKLNFEKFSKARTSVLLVGPLLSRFKEFKISRPGGDRIGLRPITTHLDAFEKLGADIQKQGDFYYIKAKELKGAEIILSEFSVTATENILMAACLAKGETIIKVAADEPHVQDLIKLLTAMGAKIQNKASHIIKIQGVKQLNGAEHQIIPDPIEVGTFIIIAALTKGKMLIKNVEPNHLDMFLRKLKEIGVNCEINNKVAEVSTAENLKAIRLQALPYPGFPTDLLPLAVPLLTQAQGKSLIHDPLYENRLNYTQELRKMGADIEIVDPHRAFVFGKTDLQGVTIDSWDIRAGASLLVAGLIARGTTIIRSVHQIDRGYEKIDERLRELGADIKRIE